VDGGSSDGTVEFLTARGVRVMAQDRRGRGRAFILGAAAASGENLVFFSLDGNEDPADIPVMFGKLDQGADMVIASRMMAGAVNEEDAGVIRLRKWVNQAFTLIVNVLWNRGPYITDTINGFRGITKKAFLGLNCGCDGFDIEFTMSIRALKAGLRIVEFPTHEYPRIGGVSTAESWPTGVLFVSRLFKEIFSGGHT
jgi:glycosyltransferase involved in cell wall biosynthesis